VIKRLIDRTIASQVDSQEWYEPSEAYCCAILRNLGGSFPGITRLSLRTTEGPVARNSKQLNYQLSNGSSVVSHAEKLKRQQALLQL